MIKKNGSFEKNLIETKKPIKAWSPPKIKHLTNVSATEDGGTTRLDGGSLS
jgi:hypothetical protein